MQLRYLKCLQSPVDGMAKITAASWAPNGQRLAIVGVDRVVHLFDDAGDKQDRFSTKAGGDSGTSFVVRALEFSPCSTKLAVSFANI